MKLKLMAFAFILAFAITSFGALGVSGVSAQITIDTQGDDPATTGVGTIVEGPCDALTGFGTAFGEITTDPPGTIPLDLVSINC